MLRLADIEGRADQKSRLVPCPLCDHFRAQRIRAQQTVGPMLLGRADWYDDGLRLLKVGTDFGPRRKVKLHSIFLFNLQARVRGAQALPSTPAARLPRGIA